MRWVGFFVASLVVVGCSSSTPATTPTSIPTTATTTTLATTTTVDRVAEIEAIYQDLEERRLDALYRGDEVTYRALFANEAYLEESMILFDLMEFEAPPEPGRASIIQVLSENETCIALEINSNFVGILTGAEESATSTVVIERNLSGWGFSYVGEGWVCDGPHPFS